MNKLVKSILLIFVALLMFIGIDNLTTVNAAYRPEDQYPSKFNRLIPGTYPRIKGTNRHEDMPVDHNFYKNGYLFNVYTVKQQEDNGGQGDMDPIVVGINNDKDVSNHQVWQALKGNDIMVPHFVHYRLQAYKHNPGAEIKHIFLKPIHLLKSLRNLFI